MYIRRESFNTFNNNKILKIQIFRNAHSDDNPACGLKYPKTHLLHKHFRPRRDSDNGTIVTLFSLHKAASGRVRCSHLIQAALETLSAYICVH